MKQQFAVGDKAVYPVHGVAEVMALEQRDIGGSQTAVYILKVLDYTRWQKKRASEILGINASTLYPIAALTHSTNPSIAQAFVAYVLSPPGEQVLKAAGFAQP